MRWDEEVRLLREEMRRVLAFLEWKASWWIEVGGKYAGTDAIHAEGLHAYSHRQASIQTVIRTGFEKQWQGVMEQVAAGREMSDPEVTIRDEEDDSDDEMA
jgi:hypothetical protein